MKIAVYALTRGDPRIEFVGSTYPMLRRPDISHFELRPTLYIHHGRNECAKDFTDHARGTHLLFIDDDMLFTDADLDAVVEVARENPGDVVGGVYWSPNPGTRTTDDVFPVVFQRQAGARDDKVFRDTWVHRPFPRGWVARQEDPFLCDAIGTGFMLIPAGVLEKVSEVHGSGVKPLAWFDYAVRDGVAIGEDLEFCVRAVGVGARIVAVPCPDLMHVKVMRIGKPEIRGEKT